MHAADNVGLQKIMLKQILCSL